MQIFFYNNGASFYNIGANRGVFFTITVQQKIQSIANSELDRCEISYIYIIYIIQAKLQT